MRYLQNPSEHSFKFESLLRGESESGMRIMCSYGNVPTIVIAGTILRAGNVISERNSESIRNAKKKIGIRFCVDSIKPVGDVYVGYYEPLETTLESSHH